MNTKDMTTLEFIIKSRRSIRKFKEGEIDPEKLEKMVEFALWAPSSCNRQTVHFRFVKKPEYIRAVAPAAFNQPILRQPITLVVVCVDLGRYRDVTLKNNLAPYLDAGLSMQNFLLAATAMNLGSCVIAGRLNQKLIKDVLNLPQNWIVAALIAIGISDERYTSPERNSVKLHISFDNEAIVPKETPYEEYISLRRRWARAGFNVSHCYRSPKEELPIFQHALAEIRQQLKNDERWLITSSLMGEFLIDEENVDHLTASYDEFGFLSNFLSSNAKFIDCSQIDKKANIPEYTYDRIISPFDVHFLGNEDIPVFAENILSWLKSDGKLTLLFFNRWSFWGLNYLFANLLHKNVTHVRYFGYETPISIAKVVNAFQKWFRVVNQETVSFLPLPNVGYLRQKTKVIIPLRFSTFFDFLGGIPLVGKFGNVAFVTLVKR